MSSTDYTRRDFLKTMAAGAAALTVPGVLQTGERPQREGSVRILNPRNRVPISFIIDDSTCLVNMAHFGIPQFHDTFPDRYPQPWRTLPREIPDSFVRDFGQWCRDNGVKGKYSIVPYPACVGWLDRFLPGWSKQELDESLNLVREFMTPDWDIHPEMISHTRVIDIQTGRPYPQASPDYMENWEWSQTRSADELAEYMAYALRVLKNVGLPCEGITTPGGFGSRNRENLARGTLEAVRDVYGTEVPHYFRDLFTDPEQSVAPQVYEAAGLDGPNPRCVVSIIGCTGDWFGGWDGLTPGSVDRFITEDLQSGRMVQVIDSGEPAIMVCHWPGIYYNGDKLGFNIFKEVVRRVHARYNNLVWMKLSEIARYWAARELTRIERKGNTVMFSAPFAAECFTVDVTTSAELVPRLTVSGKSVALKKATGPDRLEVGTWYQRPEGLMVCFDLPKGSSRLEI
ncbi:MAG: twin-arginine translocation signal domain-containing protein [Fidelibacterota bacterium]|nr:MAG: twin-arginine translocation signal domain-containing protein [Candidatus Neomarinimicrobiota bacterium]